MSGPRDFSREDMSYACRLANRHYSEDMIFRALPAKPSGRRDPGSLKYQRLLDARGRDAADAYARRTAQKAVHFVSTMPAILDRTDATVRIFELEGIAGGVPWAIYGAGTRRALEGAFVVAERVGGLSFGLALREWAELAGQDFEAVRVHRDRLVELRWIDRNSSDRLGLTARYKLRPPVPTFTHTGRSECGDPADRAWLAHDALRNDFAANALGDEGWYVLWAATRPTTVRDLSIRTGFDEEPLREILRRLEAFRLLEVDDSGLVVRSPSLVPLLDDAACRIGSTGAGAADRERHAAERESFRARRGVNVGKAVARGPAA